MKKSSGGILFLWILIAAAAAGGTFLLATHLDVSTTPSGSMTPSPAPDAQPYTDIDGGDAASGTAAAAIAMQNFSDPADGYAFSAPANWNIEKTGSDTVALHPNASSSIAACKIEISAFPYSTGADGMADWIAHHIGADPSIAVVEQSSEEVSLAGDGTGVEWIGTIDGLPTTLVYAFNAAHAYEIAPSVVGADGAGSPDDATQCNGMLQSFLSTLKI